MSAETMRAAAALMRTRAQAATPGPWTTVIPHEWEESIDGELLVRTVEGRDYWLALITPAGGEHWGRWSARPGRRAYRLMASRRRARRRPVPHVGGGSTDRHRRPRGATRRPSRRRLTDVPRSRTPRTHDRPRLPGWRRMTRLRWLLPRLWLGGSVAAAWTVIALTVGAAVTK